MILDAIIALLVSLMALLVEGVAIMFVPIINLIAVAIEAVIGIFVSGLSIGRIERKPSTSGASLAVLTLFILLILFGVLWQAFISPKVLHRKVTLVAKDGHSLPFAALIIHTRDGDCHERTDSAGNIVISRFETEAVTIKDPRYVKTTWKNSEIGSKLIVARTRLGAGLDALADQLLKPAKE